MIFCHGLHLKNVDKHNHVYKKYLLFKGILKITPSKCGFHENHPYVKEQFQHLAH